MTTHYQDLQGANGRARFFRPARYDAETVFPSFAPKLFFDDEPLSLMNISATGAAGKVKPDAADALAVGLRGVVQLRQGARRIFSAPARIARVDLRARNAEVGVALERGRFDLAELARLNAGALSVEEAPAPFDPPQDYKSFCADVLFYLGGRLEKIERHFGPIESGMTASEVEDVVDTLFQDSYDAWRDLCHRGSALVLPYHDDTAARIGLKRYTESVVTRQLLEGEGWRRSYFKPMGYPGDYKIMNYAYDESQEGSTIKEKYLHMLGFIAAEPIVTRMEKLAELAVSFSKEQQKDLIHIMSIGSGSAREIENIVNGSEPETRWSATFIDQETEALEYATNLASDIAEEGRLDYSGLNISFRDMMSATPIASDIQKQDFVYSLGLLDYFNPVLAARFIQRMYDYVRPGGRLVIANVNKKPCGMLWQCEYVLDWTLQFRTEDDMRLLTSGISDAKSRIEVDSLDAVYFLIIDKPDA